MDSEILLCHECGATNSLDSSFCAHCGTKLDHSAVEKHFKSKTVHKEYLNIPTNTLEKNYVVDRANNGTANAVISNGTGIKYKIVEYKDKITINTENDIVLGETAVIGGRLFKEWSVRDTNGMQVSSIHYHPFWKGEIKIGNENFKMQANKNQGEAYYYHVRDYQAYDQLNSKVIRIVMSPGILVASPGPGRSPYLISSNRFELQFNAGIDELTAIAFMGLTMKTFYKLPGPDSAVWYFH